MVRDTKTGPENDCPTETPGFDFKNLLEQFRLPGVDIEALLDRERKNIDAFTKANVIAFEGWRALVQKQTEIFRDTMTRAIAIAGTPSGATASKTEVAKEGFEKAVESMCELAQLVVKSQNDAYDVVRKRIQENLDEMKPLRKR